MFSVMLPERTQYIALTPRLTEYKVLFPYNMGLDMLGELDRVCEVIVNSYRSYFLLFCFLSSFWFIVSEYFPAPAGFYFYLALAGGQFSKMTGGQAVIKGKKTVTVLV